VNDRPYPDTVLCSKRHDETNLNEIGEVISSRSAGDSGSLIEFSTGHRTVSLEGRRDKLAGRILPAVEPMEESSRLQLGEDIANVGSGESPEGAWFHCFTARLVL